MTTVDKGLAVVTGASAGLGEAFARALSRRGHELLLVARREDRLRALAGELGARFVTADLGQEEGMARVWRAVDERGRQPILFVNNAGFGVSAPSTEIPAARAVEMLRLNVEAVTLLSLEASRRMKQAGRGGIINVSSTAAFQPVPHMAIYGATKGYELLFSEALNEELRGTGVRVFTLCPGATRTEFQAVAGLTQMPPAPFLATPEDCVARALAAFDAGDDVYIHGAPNAAMQFAQRFLPRRAVARLSGWMMKQPPTN